MIVDPLVSVLLVTYNHEKYVSQAIEGALMQKTDFEFEIVIGEDCSADRTREIVMEYALKYPKKIKALLHPKNLGAGGKINSLTTLQKCKGKYIAICEGDDYWTDELKLQKQVNFLESNTEFAICFHNSMIISDDNSESIAYSNSPNQMEVTTFEDLVKGEYIYTATCVFRNDHFRRFPLKFAEYFNNYTLDLHNAQFGKIKYINEVMSVYRKHNGGLWSMVSREVTVSSQLSTYKFYPKYFDKKYKKVFGNHVCNLTSELIHIKITEGNYNNFWRYYADYFFHNILKPSKTKEVLLIFVRANFEILKKLFVKNA
jgi:glycosyltransferase involved in cell wall biosynthesis